MTKNYGVLIESKKSDFVAGAESGVKYKEINASGNWGEFLPSTERQYLIGFDTMSCVSFSALNIIEIQVNFMVATKMLSDEKVKLLADWGFFDGNGKFNCSDRFTAKMSGTTQQGNSGQRVWDSIRKDGLVPEKMWSQVGVKDWNEWMAEIPQDVKNFAKNILTIFDFDYEWIVQGNCGFADLGLLSSHLRQAPLQLMAPVCGRDETGLSNPCGSCFTQHATTLYAIGDVLSQYDHYEPFIRRLSLKYTMPYILKGVVSIKQPAPTPVVAPFLHQFYQTMRLGERSAEVLWLQKALIKLGFKTYETGYYGDWTRQAVIDLQKKYGIATLADILFINGRWVGPQTRIKLNQLFS